MLCACGCGQETTWYRGKRCTHVFGHGRRKSTRHIEEDRGYRTPCWIWQLCIGKNGYGYGHLPGTRQGALAHRLAYEERHGAIPDGLVLDHLCRVKACVNPDHLEAVPQRVNVRRGNAGENLRAGAKLSSLDKMEIRLLRKSPNPPTLYELGERYGVSYSRAGQIARGEA